MKNNFKKSFIGILLVFLTFGCDNSFLEKSPIETASLNSLFATADDLLLAVNGIYDVFQGEIWGGSFYFIPGHWDGITEDAIFCCDWEGSYQLIARGGLTPSSGGIIDHKWNFGYRGISRANAVLANIDREDLEIESALRDRIKGEVRFLRALFYFELTTHYGGVPLILEPITPEESFVSRNTIDEVRTAVLEDLNYAIENLEKTPLNGEFGRPTTQAALGLKTRVLLYEEDWLGAATAAQQVIDMEVSGDTGLANDYASLFDGTNENDKEVLFDIQYEGPAVGEGNFLSTVYGPANVESGGGWQGVSFQEPMFDSFYMLDGLPFDQSSMYDPENPWINRDPRLYGTFFVPGISEWLGKPFTEANYGGLIAELPLNTKKWISETDVNTGLDGSVNFIILRYADVLLMYAEAKNELSGPDDSIYTALNKLRSRVGMPDVATGMSQDEMREAIRLERKVELTLEGHRYFDLFRWNIAEEKINSNTREVRNYTRSYLPIPQSELDANTKLEPFYPAN